MAKISEPTMTGYSSAAKDRIRVYNLIDRSCELAAQKGPHPLDSDCQCLACMTKRKKMLYPVCKDWKFSL
ncbi:MAG: hypothetical protein SWC96_03150 [Thermodesulfobacteriota bacterium]|nr:hypothetical protein [Thermodesulfobacteriota bacterium]